MASRGGAQLPPEVNRVLYIKNLPHKLTDASLLYDLFGKYGPIRQIRLGNAKKTRGTAFVVYYDRHDAFRAREALSGFRVGGRYLVALYYRASVMKKRVDNEARRKELEELKASYGV